MKRHVRFSISGEAITSIARQLWADEMQPEKAITLLQEGLQGITIEQTIAVLVGAKKLIGDSSDPKGVQMVEDDATKSENGFLLSVQAIFKRFRDKEDKLEDMVQFFSKATELVPSPKGLVEVPRRRTKTYTTLTGPKLGLVEGLNLEGIPHREVTPAIKQEKMLSRESQLKRVEKGYETPGPPYDMLEDQDLPPSPPPEPEPDINGDNGWLSPGGVFYKCFYGGHISLAQRLNHDEVRLEKLGWLKIQEREVVGLYLDVADSVTQSQRDALFDYYNKRNRPLPSWMDPEED